MQDIDFDKKVREMMDEHREMPPFGSWEKINSALDRKRARGVYFRRGMYAVSAVAASLLLLLVINRDLPEQVEKSQKHLILSENKPVVVNTEREEPAKSEPIVSRIRRVKDTPKQIAQATEVQQTPSEVAGETTEKPVSSKRVSPKREAVKDNRPYDFSDEPEPRSFRNWLGERKYKYALSTNVSSPFYKKSINLLSVSLGYQNDFIPSSLKESVRSQYVSDRNYAMPVTFGLQLQTDIDSRISIGTGVVYTLLSSTYQEISQSYSRDVHQSLHYVGIPLNGYFNLFENRSIKLYITGGVMFEKGIVASYRENTDGVKKYYSESIPGIQFSAGGGLGLEWKLSNDFGIYIDPAMAYYFKGNQPSNIRTAQPLQYKFEMGMRFEI